MHIYSLMLMMIFVFTTTTSCAKTKSFSKEQVRQNREKLAREWHVARFEGEEYVHVFSVPQDHEQVAKTKEFYDKVMLGVLFIPNAKPIRSGYGAFVLYKSVYKQGQVPSLDVFRTIALTINTDPYTIRAHGPVDYDERLVVHGDFSPHHLAIGKDKLGGTIHQTGMEYGAIDIRTLAVASYDCRDVPRNDGSEADVRIPKSILKIHQLFSIHAYTKKVDGSSEGYLIVEPRILQDELEGKSCSGLTIMPSLSPFDVNAAISLEPIYYN